MREREREREREIVERERLLREIERERERERETVYKSNAAPSWYKVRRLRSRPCFYLAW